MKTIAKLLFLLLVVASFTSCKKDPLYLIDPEENVLVYGIHKQEMNVAYALFDDHFNIAAESKGGFITPTYVFRFTDVPYEVMGQTIDLNKKSDYTLSFVFLGDVQWFTSPERVCGKIWNWNDELNENEATEYLDESPFSSGWIKFEEDDTGITFTLHGVTKNGYTIRMKLFTPVEAAQ